MSERIFFFLFFLFLCVCFGLPILLRDLRDWRIAKKYNQPPAILGLNPRSGFDKRELEPIDYEDVENDQHEDGYIFDEEENTYNDPAFRYLPYNIYHDHD
jgi:hypothetical protein